MDALLKWEPRPAADSLERLEGELRARGSLVNLFRTDGDCSAVVAVDDRAALDALVEALDPAPREVRVGDLDHGTGEPRSARASRPVRRPGLGDPFAMALIQWPAIWGLFVLPNELWAHGVRALLAVWILATVRAGFRHSHGALHGYGVGLALNAVWATVAWRYWFEWPAWIASALLVLSLLAQLRMLAVANGSRPAVR